MKCEDCGSKVLRVRVSYQAFGSYDSLHCPKCNYRTHGATGDNWRAANNFLKNRECMVLFDWKILKYVDPMELSGLAKFVKLQESMTNV